MKSLNSMPAYMLHVFDMENDQGRILEQAGSDIENWL